MKSETYQPIGALRRPMSLTPYGATWRAYTDDPNSPWGPQGPYANCGAQTKNAQHEPERRPC